MKSKFENEPYSWLCYVFSLPQNPSTIGNSEKHLSSYLLVLGKERRIHERRPRQEEVFQVVRDLPPPGQPESLHRRVLDVHVGVDAVAHEGLDDGVLGGAEVVVGPELLYG